MANALSDKERALMDAYWRAANYLSVGQIYLYDNPLLKQPLTKDHIKPRLLGHWGTTPGLNFIYVHLNRVIKKYDLDMIYITGPGHGGPGLVANVGSKFDADSHSTSAESRTSAMTFAPWAAAISIAALPTAPAAPETMTHSPAARRPASISADQAIVNGTPTAAGSSAESLAGRRATAASGSTIFSACHHAAGKVAAQDARQPRVPKAALGTLYLCRLGSWRQRAPRPGPLLIEGRVGDVAQMQVSKRTMAVDQKCRHGKLLSSRRRRRLRCACRRRPGRLSLSRGQARAWQPCTLPSDGLGSLSRRSRNRARFVRPHVLGEPGGQCWEVLHLP
jgi:XFP N-terminal domain